MRHIVVVPARTLQSPQRRQYSQPSDSVASFIIEFSTERNTVSKCDTVNAVIQARAKNFGK